MSRSRALLRNLRSRNSVNVSFNAFYGIEISLLLFAQTKKKKCTFSVNQREYNGSFI